MDEQKFWAIIDQSRQGLADDPFQQLETLRAALAPLSTEELTAFDKHYQEKLQVSYTWDLWAAAYIINGGCSDDGFDYFRDWLIAQGQAVFEAALKDPETLIGRAIPYETDFEEFRYVMVGVFEEKGGGEFPFHGTTIGKEPAGDAWDEETVGQKYPKLAAWIESAA